LTKPEGVPDTLWDEAAGSEFKAVAHETGLTAKQFAKVVEWEGTRMAKAVADMEAKAVAEGEAAVGELQKKWGLQFERRMDSAARIVQQLDPVLARDVKLGNNARFIEAMAKVADMIAEHPIGGEGRNGGGIMSAREQIAKIQADKTHAYWKGDAAAVAQMTELLARARHG
jgi:hypothetical protein